MEIACKVTFLFSKVDTKIIDFVQVDNSRYAEFGVSRALSFNNSGDQNQKLVCIQFSHVWDQWLV